MRQLFGWMLVGGLVLAQATAARAQGALNATGAYPGGAYGSDRFLPYVYGNAFTKSPTYRPHFYSPSYRSQYVAPGTTYAHPYAPYGGTRSPYASSYVRPQTPYGGTRSAAAPSYTGAYPAYTTTSPYSPYGYGSYSYRNRGFFGGTSGAGFR